MSRSPFPGVSRIDQPERNNHGWYVRLQRDKRRFQKFFPDKKLGGRQPAFDAACRHSLDLRRKHPPLSRREQAEKRTRAAGPGMIGVCRTYVVRNGRRYDVWQATWSPLPSVQKCRKFYVKSLGEREAKRRAIRARIEGLRSMRDVAHKLPKLPRKRNS